MSEQIKNRVHRYLLVIEGGPPSNYAAFSPDVPGCVATGDDVDECIAQMRDALDFHLEGLVEDGDPIPEPTGPGVYVIERSAA